MVCEDPLRYSYLHKKTSKNISKYVRHKFVIGKKRSFVLIDGLLNNLLDVTDILIFVVDVFLFEIGFVGKEGDLGGYINKENEQIQVSQHKLKQINTV
jgi:hypothetical protein